MKSSWEAFIFLPFGQGCAAACSAAFVLNQQGLLEGGNGNTTRGSCLLPAWYKRASRLGDRFPGAERAKVTSFPCKCLIQTYSLSVTGSTQAQYRFVPLSSIEIGDPSDSCHPPLVTSCSCRSAPSWVKQHTSSATMWLACNFMHSPRAIDLCLGKTRITF